MTAMGNEIPLQLAQFLRSILLGGTLALIYDLTRSLHILGGKALECVLDIFVSLGAAAAIFLFVMAEEGELRLFILLGTLGGAVLFFSLLSSVLRPIWEFWIGIFLLPLRFTKTVLIKLGYFFKKVFSFPAKWFTIMGTLIQHRLGGERSHGAQSLKTEDPPQQ